MLARQTAWILGNKHPNADKSISWDEPLANLGEPDVLIVDLTTMSEDVLERIDQGKFFEYSDMMIDKFLNGGKIIFLTEPHIWVSNHGKSNYSISPIILDTKSVPEGGRVKFDPEHEYSTYLESVKKFTFNITSYNDVKIRNKLSSYDNSSEFACLPISDQSITDNSGHLLGSSFTIFKKDGDIKRAHGVGVIIFLPPPTENIDDALSKILLIHGRSTSREPEPLWVSKIRFKNVEDKQKQIDILESQKIRLQKNIDTLKQERNSMLDHCRLIYTKNTELEDAVYEAFKILGFPDIKKIRGLDREDWVFDCKYDDRFKYGVIEVKGADHRTGQNHITQCNKWVDELYEIDKKISKGIFIPNQYRKKEYPGSTKDRKKFEPNEISYANMKNICIIPSYVFFEAVKKVLDGKAVDRKEIEQRICNTDGVLEDLLS